MKPRRQSLFVALLLVVTCLLFQLSFPALADAQPLPGDPDAFAMRDIALLHALDAVFMNRTEQKSTQGHYRLAYVGFPWIRLASGYDAWYSLFYMRLFEFGAQPFKEHFIIPHSIHAPPAGLVVS